MIRRPHKRYEAAFASFHDPVLIVDTNGRVHGANPAAQQQLDLGDRSDLRDVASLDRGVMLDGDFLLSLVRRDGGVVAHRLRDTEGNPADAVVDVVDMDEQRRHHNLKLIHIKDFSSVNRYARWKDELISMVAHEIKNPLAAMKESMNLLVSQASGPITDGQDRLLSTSIRSIDRLTRLIDGFLDVSKISAGSYTVEKRSVSARQFIPDVIESFETLFNVHRQELEYTIGSDVQEIYLDPPKVEQILVNLLSNAMKYTPSGGRIHVDVSRAGLEAMDDDYRILPWGDICPMRFVAITVRDTGIGMTSETLAHLFTRYHNAGGTAGPVPGTHLGLSISKTLTEVQNGTIHVESEPGVGTEVIVYLPLDPRTSDVLSRLQSFARSVARVVSRRREGGVYALRKYESVRWNDIAERLAQNLIINPTRDAERSGGGFMWTLGSNVALILVAGGETPPALARLLSDGTAGYATSGDGFMIGHSEITIDDTRVSRLVNVAMKRMKMAPPVVSRV